MELTESQLSSLSIKIYEVDDKKLSPLLQDYLVSIIKCLDDQRMRKDAMSVLTHIKQRIENNAVFNSIFIDYLEIKSSLC